MLEPWVGRARNRNARELREKQAPAAPWAWPILLATLEFRRGPRRGPRRDSWMDLAVCERK